MLSSAQEPTSSPDADGLLDEELVARILAGAQTYFDVLFERYNQELCAYAIHLTDHDTGYDLAAQTFAKAYENLSTLKNGDRFKHWLYRIAHNTIQDYWRRKRLRHWIPWAEIKDEQVIDGLCISALGQGWEQQLEDEAFIRRVLQYVSPTYRHCTYLNIFWSWKSPDIAVALRIPERTVRRYIEKGSEELKAVYDHLVVEHGALPKGKKK